LKISIINQWLKKDSLLDFFGHSVICTRGIDASPHTNYLQTFKEHPGPLWVGWCALLRVTDFDAACFPHTVRRGAHYSDEL
jgi:hypothetical protein